MTCKPIHSVTIVGSGNVAEAFARALAETPFALQQVWARNPERGRQVAAIFNDRRAQCPAKTGYTGEAGHTLSHPAEWVGQVAQLIPVDLCLIAVSDRAVADVAALLHLSPATIVVHTAGCVALDALAAPQRGVIYPLQTFTRGREIDFGTVPLLIEGSDDCVLQMLEAFAKHLSGTVVQADSAQRAHIHLAGVLANNFANHLFACAKGILQDAGLPYELLKPIIRETAAKAVAADDPAQAQTGPAVRNDLTTQHRHLALLGNDETLKTIYQSISKHIWETSKKI